MSEAAEIVHVPLPGGGELPIGNAQPLVVFAGPCAMEGEDHALRVAGALREISERTGVPIVYKTSFDKANRTSLHSARGVGLDEALPVFEKVRTETAMATLTDVHTAEQCARVGEVVDILQIPAFLCRQTDLLVAAAQTGRALNVKKGQFLAPWDMANVVAKCVEAGNDKIMACERGASFGYNTLVTDFRSLSIMKRFAPVVFDATHSVQQPGGQGTTSGGQREFVPALARAAVATGVAAVFAETHPDPDNAPSDGPNMIPLDKFEAFVMDLKRFDEMAKAMPLVELG